MLVTLEGLDHAPRTLDAVIRILREAGAPSDLSQITVEYAGCRSHSILFRWGTEGGETE